MPSFSALTEPVVIPLLPVGLCNRLITEVILLPVGLRQSDNCCQLFLPSSPKISVVTASLPVGLQQQGILMPVRLRQLDTRQHMFDSPPPLSFVVRLLSIGLR